MSLKDRLNLNKKEPTPIIDVPESAAQGMEIFKKLLNTNANILVSCPIDVPTHIALNFLGDKISKSKRIVAIGANLTLNRNEFIRFEPQNSSNSSLNTALTLNPAKILLQEFCGMEATDIFKLINSDIKNIITAVSAATPEQALCQAELNLYLNDINVPNELMKKLISTFVNNIVQVEKFDENTCYISKIYGMKSVKNGEYILSDLLEEKNKITKIEEPQPAKTKIIKKIKPIQKAEEKVEAKIEKKIEVKPTVKEETNILRRKLKRKKNK